MPERGTVQHGGAHPHPGRHVGLAMGVMLVLMVVIGGLSLFSTMTQRRVVEAELTVLEENLARADMAPAARQAAIDHLHTLRFQMVESVRVIQMVIMLGVALALVVGMATTLLVFRTLEPPPPPLSRPGLPQSPPQE